MSKPKTHGGVNQPRSFRFHSLDNRKIEALGRTLGKADPFVTVVGVIRHALDVALEKHGLKVD